MTLTSARVTLHMELLSNITSTWGSTGAGCSTIVPADWTRASVGFPDQSSKIYTFALAFESHKLLVCSIPGAVSTPVRRVLHDAEAILTGSTNQSVAIPDHMELADAARMLRLGKPLELMSLSEVEHIACSNEWTRLAFVRNPYNRLLSKFEDKIGKHKDYRPPAVAADGASFSRFIGRLAASRGSVNSRIEAEYVDEHFRTMSSFCGLRHIPYQVIQLEGASWLVALRAITERLGVAGDQRVVNTLSKIRPFEADHARKQVHDAYHPRDAELVRRYYAEDFRRFSYSSSM